MLNLLLRFAKTDDRARLEASMAWLYGFVRPHRLAIAGLLALSACASLLVLVQPWITKEMIDRGLVGRDFNMLFVLALAMIGAGLVGTVLGGVNRYLHTRLSGRVLFALRSAVYAHLQKLPPSFYGRRRIGDLLSRLDGDVAEIQRFALDALFSAVSSVIGLLGSVALLLTLSVKLSLLVAVLIPFEALWLRWMRRKVERDARGLRESAADLSSFLVETLPAMKFIQASGQQNAERERLERFGDRYMDRLLKLQVTEFFTQSVPGLFTSISRASAFLVGGYWVVQGAWQLGALIAFTTYLGMAVGPVKSLLGLYVALQRMTVSLTRVVELQHEPVIVQETETPATAPEDSTLEFDDVWFSHEERAHGVLRGASAVLPAGRKIALAGASGAGKSTLIDLVQRFYDPQQGSLRLGGVDLRDLQLDDLRRRVAVVSQDIVLFRGSLADNIGYGAPHASREQIALAAHAAQLDSLVATLPEGLDSQIGERGQQLSGGQKQRIAIARALLQEPSILVLDEATSAVDEATEREVIAQIDTLFAARTRILISHRAATLAHADLHFDLIDGRLVTREAQGAAHEH
ncbi:ATP-binding cassette subfamily B protein [Paraburkholderia eburnea]|uniref:Cyclolysin secretion/processing ATP-binding protein CyaB n=1 Tax=Paraburkholderia eburnea TaxID=1189126 RepID=A0A2S4MDN1_9BURK|nr:ABC transporter ATP-binding protein [Paraburkholderia eburnea]POR52856.1 ATP-binding cassette subfamily B protein [Paraburkholderia eburnea]PRZ23723.1 ATP-binding cassette subfamily B protein [Paraburkholderia eburnea]